MNNTPVSKRARLAEIVATLGEHATNAEIREAAYRSGFGNINTDLMREAIRYVEAHR